MRSITRTMDCSINTVTKLLVDAGSACRAYQDEHQRNLPCKRVQLDEIWAFCFSKAKNVPEEKQGQPGYGDIWTWTALCADTKLTVSWLVGARDGEYALAFAQDHADKLASWSHVTTDGYKAYLDAVDMAFAGEVDYAQLIKMYGNPPQAESRYCPADCVEIKRNPVSGNPDWKRVSTSYVERSNLTIRMGMRRFTRLTNAHSKKMEIHQHAFSLFAMDYNFARIHKALRVTPAMEAVVADHAWTMEEIAALANWDSTSNWLECFPPHWHNRLGPEWVPLANGSGAAPGGSHESAAASGVGRIAAAGHRRWHGPRRDSRGERVSGAIQFHGPRIRPARVP